MLPFKFVLILTLALAASAPASALTFESLQHGVDLYNSGMENAPGVVKTLLGDERIQIEVTRPDGTALVAGLETEKAVVVNLTAGEINNPTIVVEAREDAIKRIYESDDPAAAFQEARDLGEITITGTTWSAKAKVAAALASSSAIRFFAGLVGG